MKTFSRPEITEEKIETIRRLIEENPDMCRSRLSVVLCELWQWRTSEGKTKDMSCRDLLLSLEKVGKITLPPRRTKPRQIGDQRPPRHLNHDETPIICSLKGLQPLRIEIVSSEDELEKFKSYINQYHYLKFGRGIGERMAYMVYSHDGIALSCLLFGAAAWSCMERDKHIGWGKEHRRHNISMITNNSRFLIFPWVRVPHLASHILSLIAKRISADWEQKYGHPICLLETFVDTEKFKGTCYKAANWIYAGSTTGRGRNGGHNYAVLSIKNIYLYPLGAEFQQKLTNRKGLTGCNDRQC